MISLSTIGAWLASPIVGFFAKMLIDWLTARRAQDLAAENAKNLGRLETANKINVETLQTKNAMDEVPRPSDDAVADSLRSGKF
jgi:hypothetical protein